MKPFKGGLFAWRAQPTPRRSDTIPLTQESTR